jgi:hypothetical protein
MNCRKCGTANDDNAYKCVQCGEILHSAPRFAGPVVEVQSYLLHSILVTVLCCMPLGVPAIVCAVKARNKAAMGDYEGAVAASDKAKTWCWVSFGVGIAVLVLYTILAVLGAGPTK